MKTSHRRIALLPGASISALGVSSIFATPAFAAPHDGATPGTFLADGTYTGIDSTADTLTICDIAVSPAPDSPCFYGVIDTVSPAFATVNDTAHGQIYHHQTGGDITLDLINDGSAEVGAIAVATGTPAAVAVAYATSAIRQVGARATAHA